MGWIFREFSHYHSKLFLLSKIWADFWEDGKKHSRPHKGHTQPHFKLLLLNIRAPQRFKRKGHQDFLLGLKQFFSPCLKTAESFWPQYYPNITPGNCGKVRNDWNKIWEWEALNILTQRDRLPCSTLAECHTFVVAELISQFFLQLHAGSLLYRLYIYAVWTAVEAVRKIFSFSLSIRINFFPDFICYHFLIQRENSIGKISHQLYCLE